VPLEYSIAWLTCALASGPVAVMVSWPGAAQDRVPADVPRLLRATLVFRGDPAKAAELLVLRHENADAVRHITGDHPCHWLTPMRLRDLDRRR
jgi:hypothetical protein